MTSFEILFFVGVLAGATALIAILMSYKKSSWLVPTILAGFFIGFSAITMWQEGILGFIPRHSEDFWGVQVWYDLVFCVGIGLFLIIPRAKAVGMHVLPWSLAVFSTASIALLPMLARVLYLEQLVGRANNQID